MSESVLDLAAAAKRVFQPLLERLFASRNVNLVSESGLFDRAFYLAEYPDVAAAGIDPVVHYLECGFREGREPGPDFNTAYYLEQVLGADISYVAPLVHYLRVGRPAGLKPRPVLKNPPSWMSQSTARNYAWSLDDVGDLMARLRDGSRADASEPVRQQPSRPRILFVIATRTGGTPLTNQDLMTSLSAEHECFVLHCTRNTVFFEYFADGVYTKLDHHVLSAPIAPILHQSDEYDRVVFRWLLEWRIGLVHVRHIAWHGLGLVDMARLLAVPVVFSFHDYYTVCPTVKLLDDRGQFCGGVCTDSPGDCMPEDIWPADGFGRLKHAQVRAWQVQFRELLARCDAFVTTTEQVRRIIVGRYPELATTPFAVIPHGRDFNAMEQLASPPREGDTLRLVIPGNVSVAKGGEIIAALAALTSPDDLEIHVLGSVSPRLQLPENVVLHGVYVRGELHERLAAIRPQIGAVLSIWPETWCHTLTELWAAGVPVVGFDTGAVGERLRASGAGWVTSEMTAAAVVAALSRARRPAEWSRASGAVKAWQTGEGLSGNCQAMGKAYLELYRVVSDDFSGMTSAHPAGSSRESEART